MITKEEWKKIRGSKVSPDHIMLSIKGDAARAMTVTWRTDVSVENGFALYRKKGSNDEWLKAVAKKNTFETDVDLSNYFSADMSGLTPDTQYEYTCGDDTHRSEVFCFKSAKESCDKFSFLCLLACSLYIVEDPSDFCRTEICVDDKTGLASYRVCMAFLLERVAVFGCTPVLPYDGIINRLSSLCIPYDGCLSLIGYADCGDVESVDVDRGYSLCDYRCL